MSFFTDTIQKSPFYRAMSVVMDVNLLEPVTRAAVLAIVADAAAMGKTLRIVETYRSQTRQQVLFEHGATQLRTVGVHHYGLAADLALIIGGRYVANGNAYLFLRDLCIKHKLVWGGDWADPSRRHSIFDPGHVQRVAVADQPALFAGTWYPEPGWVASALG
jgi:hypothetical protein